MIGEEELSGESVLSPNPKLREGCFSCLLSPNRIPPNPTILFSLTSVGEALRQVSAGWLFYST